MVTGDRERKWNHPAGVGDGDAGKVATRLLGLVCSGADRVDSGDDEEEVTCWCGAFTRGG